MSPFVTEDLETTTSKCQGCGFYLDVVERPDHSFIYYGDAIDIHCPMRDANDDELRFQRRGENSLHKWSQECREVSLIQLLEVIENRAFYWRHPKSWVQSELRSYMHRRCSWY